MKTAHPLADIMRHFPAIIAVVCVLRTAYWKYPCLLLVLRTAYCVLGLCTENIFVCWCCVGSDRVESVRVLFANKFKESSWPITAFTPRSRTIRPSPKQWLSCASRTTPRPRASSRANNRVVVTSEPPAEIIVILVSSFEVVLLYCRANNRGVVTSEPLAGASSLLSRTAGQIRGCDGIDGGAGGAGSSADGLVGDPLVDFPAQRGYAGQPFCCCWGISLGRSHGHVGSCPRTCRKVARISRRAVVAMQAGAARGRDRARRVGASGARLARCCRRRPGKGRKGAIRASLAIGCRHFILIVPTSWAGGTASTAAQG